MSQTSSNKLAIPPEEIETLNKQANEGDRAALTRIREAMAADRSLIRHLGGDLCRNAEGLNAEAVSCGQPVQAAAVEAHLDVLREDLTRENDCPVERLLIDRVATCWLTLHALEQESALEYLGKPAKPPTLDRAIDRAHRRFLSAVSVFSQFRRANRPLAIDLNVAAQASSGHAPEDCAESPENQASPADWDHELSSLVWNVRPR